MISRRAVIGGLSACPLLRVSNADGSAPALIFTLYAPPLVTNFPERPGFAQEIVEEMFESAGLPYSITILPWQRSQVITQTRSEALIFPLTRTPTREDGFDWSVNICSTSSHFVSLNGVSYNRDNIGSARIAVLSGSSWQNWLDENGITNYITLLSEDQQFVETLRLGRVDAWLAELTMSLNLIDAYGLGAATIGDPIDRFDVYLASNKDHPYEGVEPLKNALSEMISSGRYGEIISQYFDFPDFLYPRTQY